MRTRLFIVFVFVLGVISLGLLMQSEVQLSAAHTLPVSGDRNVHAESSIMPGAWEAIADPSPWNTGNELVALSNGHILYLGGGYASSAFGASNEVHEYNPTTNTWTAKSPMLEERRTLGAAVLNNLVYAIGGGEYEGENPTNTVERFDPQTNTWSYVSPMNFRRSRIGATAFDDKIYVFGGLGESGMLDSIEVYDPSLNIWFLSSDALPELPTDCSSNNCGTTAVASGNRIYVFIGWGTFQSPHLWAYDPNAPAGTRWTPNQTPSLGSEWGSPEPNAAALDQLLSYMPANSFEGHQSFGLFDTTTGQWSQVAAPQRDGHPGGASVGTGGYVYTVGGYTYGPRAERYDPRKILEITSPTPGSISHGTIRVWGSADRTDLDSYRFYWKVAQEPDSSYQPIGPARTTPVLDGTLETWDTIDLGLGEPPAQYTLKLVMADTTGLFTDTVVQQVIIDNSARFNYVPVILKSVSMPTATPPPTATRTPLSTPTATHTPPVSATATPTPTPRATPPAAGQWQSLRPDGGTVNVLAISPNYSTDATLFTGTEGGTVSSSLPMVALRGAQPMAA